MPRGDIIAELDPTDYETGFDSAAQRCVFRQHVHHYDGRSWCRDDSDPGDYPDYVRDLVASQIRPRCVIEVSLLLLPAESFSVFINGS